MASKIVTQGNAFISTYIVDPDKRDEFYEIFTGLWTPYRDLMEREVNFVFYGWGRNENQFIAVESWKSEEATNAVRASKEFQDGVSRMLACCSVPMTMQVFNGIDADRSVFALYPPGRSSVHPSIETVETIFL